MFEVLRTRARPISISQFVQTCSSPAKFDEVNIL